METNTSDPMRDEGAAVTFLRLASGRRTVAGALRVAALVGTVLNVVNQGGPLLRFELGAIDWWKAGFTYLVPFCVSVYSATRMQMQLVRAGSSVRGRMDP
jgi:hypothetical protein